MWLLYVIGAWFAFCFIVSVIERIKKIPVAVAEKKRIEQLAIDTEAREAQLTQERARFEQLKVEAATALETISREKSLGFPWLATAYSEYQKLYELKLADQLEAKKPPAKRAAEDVRAMAAEKASLRRENRILRELFRYYESLFPWLIDFKGEDLDDLISQRQPAAAMAFGPDDVDVPGIEVDLTGLQGTGFAGP